MLDGSTQLSEAQRRMAQWQVKICVGDGVHLYATDSTRDVGVADWVPSSPGHPQSGRGEGKVPSPSWVASSSTAQVGTWFQRPHLARLRAEPRADTF